MCVQVKIGSDSLTQKLEVKNEGSEPMPFTTAFHTYFLVSDVDSAYADLGSSGLTYQDNTKGRAESKLSGSSVKFQQEFDAIFVGAPDTIKAGFLVWTSPNLREQLNWTPLNGCSSMQQCERFSGQTHNLGHLFFHLRCHLHRPDHHHSNARMHHVVADASCSQEIDLSQQSRVPQLDLTGNGNQ